MKWCENIVACPASCTKLARRWHYDNQTFFCVTNTRRIHVKISIGGYNNESAKANARSWQYECYTWVNVNDKYVSSRLKHFTGNHIEYWNWFNAPPPKCHMPMNVLLAYNYIYWLSFLAIGKFVIFNWCHTVGYMPSSFPAILDLCIQRTVSTAHNPSQTQLQELWMNPTGMSLRLEV